MLSPEKLAFFLGFYPEIWDYGVCCLLTQGGFLKTSPPTILTNLRCNSGVILCYQVTRWLSTADSLNIYSSAADENESQWEAGL